MVTNLEKTMIEKYNLDSDANGIICPFHEDNRGGSFKFNVFNGVVRYKCFSCGCSGKETTLRNKLFFKNNDLTKEEAAVYKKSFKDCTPKEKYLKRQLLNKMDSELGKVERTQVQFEETVSFSDEELDLIHSFYTRVISKTKLNMSDFRYLNETRGISKEDIEKYMYRSFNDRSMDVINETIELFKSLYSTSQLLRIPGMFLNDKTKRVEFKKVNGIIIPIIQNGRLAALQVRSNATGPNVLRYFWVSSVKEGGTSPGAPWYSIDEIDEDLPWIITEGQFKAAAIKNKLAAGGKKANIISIQGIGNGKPLAKFITELYKETMYDELDRAFEKTIDTTLVTLALDKDVVVNDNNEVDTGVITKRKNINTWLQEIANEQHRVKVMTWDEDEKGIDDLFEAHPNAKINYIDYKEFTNVIK